MITKNPFKILNIMIQRTLNDFVYLVFNFLFVCDFNLRGIVW